MPSYSGLLAILLLAGCVTEPPAPTVKAIDLPPLPTATASEPHRPKERTAPVESKLLLGTPYRALAAKLVPANTLSITPACLTLTNFVFQIEPMPTNPIYITKTQSNVWTTNWFLNTAYIGRCVRLDWQTTPGPAILQESTNLTQWRDIKVRYLGTGGCYVGYLARAKFYRLRTE